MFPHLPVTRESGRRERRVQRERGRRDTRPVLSAAAQRDPEVFATGSGLH